MILFLLKMVFIHYLVKEGLTNDDEQELTAGNVPLTLGGTGATEIDSLR